MANENKYDYDKLMRQIEYGDPLHMGRFGVWVTAHSIFLGLLGANLKDLDSQPRWILCILGMLLCLFWICTAKRMSDRLKWLNKKIKKLHPDSVHAEWLGIPKCRCPSTTLILTYLLPLSFLAAYALLALFAGD
jgi:hypothetical protein